jgi:hypothetical protein
VHINIIYPLNYDTETKYKPQNQSHQSSEQRRKEEEEEE